MKASSQQANSHITLHSCIQIHLDLDVQLNVDSEAAFLVLWLVILVEVGGIVQDLDSEVSAARVKSSEHAYLPQFLCRHALKLLIVELRDLC